MDDLKATTEKAIAFSIAEKILETITSEQREFVLRKSITDSLTSYSYRSVIEKIVSERATEIVRKMLGEKEWQLRLEASVQRGLNELLKKLPGAAEKAFSEALFGREGKDSYDRRPGAVVAYLPAQITGE